MHCGVELVRHMATVRSLSQVEFLRTLPGVVIPHLPGELQDIQVRQPWRWLVQMHYGDPALHFEVSHVSRLNGWELGFHCESRDAELNRALLRGFQCHLAEIRDTLGERIEAEQWDKGWTKIYEVYPGGAITEVYQAAIGQRLAQIIRCLQPIFADLHAGLGQARRN
jgi:hypothetical protein